MPGAQDASMRELARQRAMYFEIAREHRVSSPSEVAAIEFRLSGRHATDARPSPGCPQCKDVSSDLESVARWVFPARLGRTSVEFLPAEQTLYSLSHDYVHLRIRISNHQRLGHGLGGGAEGILAAARGRLTALGLCER